MLDYKDLMVVGDFGAHLFDLVDRYNRLLPKWCLNGWSYAELAEGAKGDATAQVTEPAPSELPDFSADDASGFAWPPEGDDDGGLWPDPFGEDDEFDW